MSGVFGVIASIFAWIRSFFSVDSEVAGKVWYRPYLDFFIILILVAVGAAMIYVIVFPLGTPPYP